jgi:hypothetical protein
MNSNKKLIYEIINQLVVKTSDKSYFLMNLDFTAAPSAVSIRR